MSLALPRPTRLAYECMHSLQMPCSSRGQVHFLVAEGWWRAVMLVGDSELRTRLRGHSELGAAASTKAKGGICILEACWRTCCYSCGFYTDILMGHSVGTSTICRQWGACPNAVHYLTCGFVGFLPNLMKLIDIVPPSSLTSFLPQTSKFNGIQYIVSCLTWLTFINFLPKWSECLWV